MQEREEAQGVIRFIKITKKLFVSKDAPLDIQDHHEEFASGHLCFIVL